jgi:hypothetical protein
MPKPFFATVVSRKSALSKQWDYRGTDNLFLLERLLRAGAGSGGCHPYAGYGAIALFRVLGREMLAVPAVFTCQGVVNLVDSFLPEIHRAVAPTVFPASTVFPPNSFVLFQIPIISPYTVKEATIFKSSGKCAFRRHPMLRSSRWCK